MAEDGHTTLRLSLRTAAETWKERCWNRAGLLTARAAFRRAQGASLEAIVGGGGGQWRHRVSPAEEATVGLRFKLFVAASSASQSQTANLKTTTTRLSAINASSIHQRLEIILTTAGSHLLQYDLARTDDEFYSSIHFLFELHTSYSKTGSLIANDNTMLATPALVS